MARRLSKKKISGWLLLLAVIIFFRCGGRQKLTSAVSGIYREIGAGRGAKVSVADARVDERLVARLDSFVRATHRLGELGVYVYDETAGREVFAYNADSLLRPASNMKMLTCLTALRKLGPNYHFESGAYVKGEMRGDTLVGDIALKFTFDPWFSTDSLWRLADAFRGRGIRRVEGRVVLDLKMREPMKHEEHWTVGDLKVRRLGLLYRGEARIRSEVMYALRSHGVNFSDEQLVVDKAPDGAEEIGRTRSLMRRSVFRALQNSSNEHAECLTFALSGMYPGETDFRRGGTRYLRRFIAKELKVEPDSVSRIHDGSGLCVHDRLSPRFLVRMLHYACGHKYIYDELRRCLPISGRTGTLHDRMMRPSVRGKVQAKTGTLTREDGITSLSGFVTSQEGHLLLFGVIQNEVPVADARLWQNRFCEQMVK